MTSTCCEGSPLRVSALEVVDQLLKLQYSSPANLGGLPASGGNRSDEEFIIVTLLGSYPAQIQPQ